MNVFLIHESLTTSANILFKNDPVRARKQLLECCQILASVDHLRWKKTAMLRADGQPYGSTHPHHPCVQHAFYGREQWFLTYDVAVGLANVMPDHACSVSLKKWLVHHRSTVQPNQMSGKGLVVVRRNAPKEIVYSRQQYALLMRRYLEETKGFPKNVVPHQSFGGA